MCQAVLPSQAEVRQDGRTSTRWPLSPAVSSEGTKENPADTVLSVSRSEGDHTPVIEGAILFFGVFRAKGHILLFSHLVRKRNKDTEVMTGP